MIESILNIIYGSKFERDLKENIPVLHKINEKEIWAISLKNDDFKLKTQEFREKIKAGEKLDHMIPEAFALVREAARRILKERPYDTQMLGAIALHQGRIMELKTGEGKTLSSVPAAYLNSLTGKGVHLVTVNDYLAKRDATWMEGVYDLLGVSVGYITSDMSSEDRKKAYLKDVTYITNNELGFDYLRDNMRLRYEDRVQRFEYSYCIIDEIDSILIDEARTPLIISGVADDNVKIYQNADSLVQYLVECEKDERGEYKEGDIGDYKLELKDKRVSFSEQGLISLEKLLKQKKYIQGSLFEGDNISYIHYVTQALKAHYIFKKEVDYVINSGKIEIVDEFTGRILSGRRYSDGLHQAIEAKERVKIAKRNTTVATITFQNFFRMYKKISGMTGTAETESKEFINIYGLDVNVIPTNRPVVREDLDDLIYIDGDSKFNAILKEIKVAHEKGQPILVGTISIENSEKLSKLLIRNGIRHEVLNAKNHAKEAIIVADAGVKGSVTIATNMAGRGTDIKLGGNYEFRAQKKLPKNSSPEEAESKIKEEYQQWLKDSEEVKNLGGLYIIGSERHESRRIDNQLRGRSGRQGDPGKSRFFICMDDELIKLFSGNKGQLKSTLARIGVKKDEALEHRFLTRTVERAQKKVEERNYEVRKHLLEFDDVLSKQREFLYSEREVILQDGLLINRALVALKDLIEDFCSEYVSDRESDVEKLKELLKKFKLEIFFSLEDNIEHLKTIPYNELSEEIYKFAESNLREKEKIIGKEQFNLMLRFEYLKNIDYFLQEHLENLSSLREAVYLRSYAQRTPLTEYKLEGAKLFDDLIYGMKTNIFKRLLSFKIVEKRS